MSFAECVRTALGALAANPLRTFLTLLGMVIAVTAIIAVAAVIHGLDLYVAEKIATLGPTSFEVNRFGIITNRKEFLQAIRRNPDLRVSDGEALRQGITLAELVGFRASSETEVRHRGEVCTSVRIRGATPEVLAIEPFELAAGRPLLEEDDDRAAAVAVLGWDLAKNLFGPLDPLGRSVKIWGRSFTVVGVGAAQGSVFGQSRDNYALIPFSTYQKQVGRRESISIVVRVRRPDEVEPAMDEARTILRSRHHLRYHEPDDFGFVTSEAINSLWKSLSRTLFRVATFVVGISLVVGGIVIMNIMLVSVIERTQEIGIRKAVGARDADVKKQFLVESAILAAIGGLIGVAAAQMGTLAVRTWSPLPAVAPWWSPVVSLGVSSAVGIFFGLHPAAKAASLDPIEALRKE